MKKQKRKKIPYPPHLDFKLLFYEVNEDLLQLDSFLDHIHSFIKRAEKKLEKTKVYSPHFFEYYHVGSYGETFRSAFIVSLCSIAESHIKNYVLKCNSISLAGLSSLRKDGIMDYLKKVDKKFIGLNLDYDSNFIVNLKGLLAFKNSIVHSSGTFDDVIKYKPQILQLSKKFNSIKIIDDKFIVTTENFCRESLDIVQFFFYYLSKCAIRRYYNYVSGKEYLNHEIKNSR